MTCKIIRKRHPVFVSLIASDEEEQHLVVKPRRSALKIPPRSRSRWPMRASEDSHRFFYTTPSDNKALWLIFAQALHAWRCICSSVYRPFTSALSTGTLHLVLLFNSYLGHLYGTSLWTCPLNLLFCCLNGFNRFWFCFTAFNFF